MHLTLMIDSLQKKKKKKGRTYIFLIIESAPNPSKKTVRILPPKIPRDNSKICWKFRGICVRLVFLSLPSKEKKKSES